MVNLKYLEDTEIQHGHGICLKVYIVFHSLKFKYCAVHANQTVQICKYFIFKVLAN